MPTIYEVRYASPETDSGVTRKFFFTQGDANAYKQEHRASKPKVIRQDYSGGTKEAIAALANRLVGE